MSFVFKRMLSAAELTSLIPALNGGCNRVKDDSKVENPGVLPSVSLLFVQDAAIFFIELGNMVDMKRVLGSQRPLDE